MKKTTRFITSLVLMALVSVLFQQTFDIPIYDTFGVLFGIGFGIGLFKNSFNLNTSMPVDRAYDGIIISDTTYAGEAASQFIVKAITDNTMVQGGNIYVKDGIKKKFTIPRWDMDYEDLIQDAKATPVSKGDQKVDGKALNPAEFMVYHEFNPRDYEDHWFATQIPGSTLLDTALPATAESVLIQEVLKRYGRYINKSIWNSDTSTTGIYRYFDGLKKKATAASDTIKVGSPVTLTTSNIQAQLQRGFDLIPAALKYNRAMKYFISYATFELYMQSQINQTNKGVDVTQVGIDSFRGLKVVPIPDFPDNYYMIAKGSSSMDSNLWMGLNSTDDNNTIQLARLQANSELYFIKMLCKLDVQIGWNSETVTYE